MRRNFSPRPRDRSGCVTAHGARRGSGPRVRITCVDVGRQTQTADRDLALRALVARPAWGTALCELHVLWIAARGQVAAIARGRPARVSARIVRSARRTGWTLRQVREDTTSHVDRRTHAGLRPCDDGGRRRWRAHRRDDAGIGPGRARVARACVARFIGRGRLGAGGRQEQRQPQRSHAPLSSNIHAALVAALSGGRQSARATVCRAQRGVGLYTLSMMPFSEKKRCCASSQSLAMSVIFSSARVGKRSACLARILGLYGL